MFLALTCVVPVMSQVQTPPLAPDIPKAFRAPTDANGYVKRDPTMWLQGLWDQEDMWGAIHSYMAVEPKDAGNDKNYLVMGPWFHSQVNREGRTLGPLHWGTDTTLQFRRDFLKPFIDQYLKDGAPKAATPPVLIYNTGGTGGIA